MEFKTDTEALTILQNPPDDHFLWIAALDHLLHKASGDMRLRMMNKFESMPHEKKIEIRRMLDVYQATQIMLPQTGK
jgi:hypothetical protein